MYQTLLNILDIFLTLAGAFVVAMFVPPKTRSRWMPWVFAYIIGWVGGGELFLSMINLTLYRLLYIVFFLAMGVVLSDFRFSSFRRNGAWSGFLLFFLYFMLVGFQGIGSIGEVLECHFKIIRMIIVGYLVGYWAISNPGGFARLIKATTLVIGGVALLYALKGSWNLNALEDAGGRLVVDTSAMMDAAGSDQATSSAIRGKFNVNRFALLTTMMLPYPFLMLMCNYQGRYSKQLRLLAMLSCLVLTLILFRTGSRNGAAGLFGFVWFFVFAKTGLKAWKKYLIVGVMSCIVAYGVLKSLRGGELRSFNFNEDQATTLRDFGNGRGEMLYSIYDSMTTTQHIFGKGVPWKFGGLRDENGRLSVGNDHSIYIQIFEQSGYVGLLLFAFFCLAFYASAKKSGRRYYVAMLFFSVFVFTGLGEAANISPSAGYAKYGLGIAMALCCKKRGQFDIFLSDGNWVYTRYP